MIELIANGEGKLWVTLMEQLTQGKTLGTEAVGPCRPVNHGDVIQVGDHTFRIHHYGPAHTTSDIMIELAQQHTVFLGDNVLNGRLPRIDGGSITGSTQACSEILKTGATHYVPGHGKSGDAAVVKAMFTYFDTLYRNVNALYEEGLSDFEMKDTISEKLSAYADWEDFNVQLGKHISFAFLQIESVQF
jgi:glyoxylase-like metal-dependent hydrolase (beta-lactamase superfamily II)